MIIYDGLNAELKKRNIGKTELTNTLGLSTRTVAKISKNEKLSVRTLEKIADFLSLCKMPNRKKDIYVIQCKQAFVSHRYPFSMLCSIKQRKMFFAGKAFYLVGEDIL